jgi:ribosomal protein S18 acetylase RimI-like enzyme
MEIRRATLDDALPVARVHIDSWRSAYRGLVPDAYLDGLNYERRAERLRDLLSAGASETYLAAADGQILGFLDCGGCRDTDVDLKATGEIWGIYLAPEHWRKGIGTLLCRHGEQVLAGRGYATVALWVFEGNARARRFYEAMGFIVDGASKSLDFGVPLKVVRYQKQLASVAQE